MITFKVSQEGKEQEIEVPDGINLSLMEVLKASDYRIQATCGGMALCATCHVKILNGQPTLFEPSELELEMLDTLPNSSTVSRLACQIKITEQLQGSVIALAAADNQ